MTAPGSNERGAGPLYVYAIIPSAPGIAIPRIDGIADRLSTIDAGGYTAVVGDGTAPELKGRSREELGRRLVDHQKVVEQIMRSTRLLPVQFGTQVPDEPGVRAMLERGAPLFDNAFAEFGDCSQLEVLVTWDVGTVLAELVAQEPLARLRARLAVDPATPLAEREDFGRCVKAAFDTRRTEVAHRIETLLRDAATGIIVHPTTDDRIVLHLTLLVRGNALAAVDQRLEMIDKEYDGCLHFRCIGPMPPSSFAAVCVDILDADTIAQASRILGVRDNASFDDVRAAYRKRVKATHPDAGMNGGEARPMAELTAAYKTLSIRAGGPACDGRDDTGAEPRAVLVSLWRPEPSAGADRQGAADA